MVDRVAYRKKMLKIVIVITTLVIVVMLFKKNIFRFWCEREENASACFILGNYSLKENNENDALYYFEKGCDGKYLHSCDALVSIYEKKGDEAKEKYFIEKSCQLMFTKKCSKK